VSEEYDTKLLEQRYLFTTSPISQHPTDIFSFGTHGKTILTLKRDGSIVLGEGVTVDEASKFFWDHLPAKNPLHDKVEKLEARIQELEYELAKHI
jgi:hypothetical protein